MTTTKAYQEIIDFIASGTSPNIEHLMRLAKARARQLLQSK